MTFQFDTSGVVEVRDAMGNLHNMRWNGLSPFVQGYVEALFRSLREGDLGYLPLSALKNELRYDRLARETLARIMEDCAAIIERTRWTDLTHKAGALTWRLRQESSAFYGLLPVTPYLGDDGKVYLREA